MELFPARPDLSLQISPPNTKPSSTWRRPDEDENNFQFWDRLRDLNLRPNSPFDLSLSNPNLDGRQDTTSIISSNDNFFMPHYLQYNGHLRHRGQPMTSQELAFFRAIRGIPIYQYQQSPNPYVGFARTRLEQACLPSANSVCMGRQSLHPHHSPRLGSRFLTKRSSRAPRMRWTTSLHARFIWAVELLGGHDRATPKSILELMDVKDLTLAHVKSHLQMYRTVKTTDKAAALSPGDTAEDLIELLLTPKGGTDHKDGHGMQIEQSRGRKANWLQREDRTRDFGGNSSSLEQKDSASDYERVSETGTSSPERRPNLEFTLGRS